MRQPAKTVPPRLVSWLREKGVLLWGAADIHDVSPPADVRGVRFPTAISFAVPMDPHIMATIRRGPTQAYTDEYARVNILINARSEELSELIAGQGYRSQPLAASERTDSAALSGAFPHKTAATRAGLGWIGRHCQIITRSWGPWVRLGTVFTDMPLPCGAPSERSFCGTCTLCVDACPAGALTGADWTPEVPREAILDAHACDTWKSTHYFRYHKGRTCGICLSVCPYGLKVLRRRDL